MRAVRIFPSRNPSSGTPRNVTTSRDARQLLTTILIGTAARTPGIRAMADA
jgi:hypothetical protein